MLKDEIEKVLEEFKEQVYANKANSLTYDLRDSKNKISINQALILILELVEKCVPERKEHIAIRYLERRSKMPLPQPMTKRFRVCYQPPLLENKFMQIADLFHQGEGVVIDDLVKEDVFRVTWKDEEIVNDLRIKQTVEYIRESIEQQGGIVFDIDIL